MSVQNLIELIVAGASRVDPAKPAVAYGNDNLSYEQLLSGAKGVAATLAAAGVKRGDRVALWMDKTPRCVQVLLGVMWCGAAYVPLDPRAPWKRSRSVLLDCGVAALVVDSPRFANLEELLSEISLRILIADGAAPQLGDIPTVLLDDALTTPERPLPTAGLDDLAYILYTSGSTGTPKGVAHTHRSALGFTRWVQERFEIVPDDIFSSHAPFHFDLSISDLYASLGSGATVRLISTTAAMLAPYLVKSVAVWGITVWYSTPSILISMMEVGELEAKGFGDVRLLFFAGEVFPTPQLLRLRRALPRVRLYNLFGPTETNVCTYYEVPAEDQLNPAVPIPIGKGCENLDTFVIDDDGREVSAVGGEGILWAKGDNIMLEYWKNPSRTAEVLYADPRGFAGRACRTGDRVRLRADGNYDFLGRTDHMIKTRGYRVELGELESTLASHPSVLEAIAVPVPDEKIGNRLLATVVLRAGQKVESKALQAHCGEHLPLYMMPEQIEIRTSLPQTSTGKADRATLLAEWLAKESP